MTVGPRRRTSSPALHAAPRSRSCRSTRGSTAERASTGGDEIGGCTSNFTFHDIPGHSYTFTAAHCGYAVGTAYYQHGNYFGHVTAFQWGGSNIGAALIQLYGTSRARIWSDPNAIYRSVKGYSTTDPIGGLICTNAAVEAEVCNIRIDKTGQTLTYGNHTMYNAVQAHQLNGTDSFAPGSSGGPVETTGGLTNSTARGVIDATVTGDYATGWYTPIRYPIGSFNVTLNTE